MVTAPVTAPVGGGNIPELMAAFLIELGIPCGPSSGPAQPTGAAMPLRHLKAFFEPRSVGILAENFAPGTHGALALQALAATKPHVPVVLIGPPPSQAPFPAVPSLADIENVPDLALITLPACQTPPILTTLGERGARGAILTQHDHHDPELREALKSTA